MFRFNELIKKIAERAYFQSRFFPGVLEAIGINKDELDKELDQFREDNLGKYITSEKGFFGPISSQITMDNPKIEVGECNSTIQPVLKFKVDDSRDIIIFPLLQQRYRVDTYPFLLFDDKDSLDLFYLIKEAPDV